MRFREPKSQWVATVHLDGRCLGFAWLGYHRRQPAPPPSIAFMIDSYEPIMPVVASLLRVQVFRDRRGLQVSRPDGRRRYDGPFDVSSDHMQN